MVAENSFSGISGFLSDSVGFIRLNICNNILNPTCRRPICPPDGRAGLRTSCTRRKRKKHESSLKLRVRIFLFFIRQHIT